MHYKCIIMNRSIRKILWSLILLAIQGCSGSAKQEQKILRLGLSADYPPFEFKQDGKVVGFDVDLATELAQELGFSLEIQDMDFSALIPSLNSGRVDFVMSGMAINE